MCVPPAAALLCCAGSRGAHDGNLQCPAEVDAEGESCGQHRGQPERRLSARRGRLAPVRTGIGMPCGTYNS